MNSPQTTAVADVVQVVAVGAAETAPTQTTSAPKRPIDDFLDEPDEPEAELTEETAAQLAAIFGPEGAAAGEDAGQAAEGEAASEAEGDEADTSDVDLSSLEDFESDEEEGAVFHVFKKRCLECKALVPWKEKAFRTCHHSAGNENCPAQSVQIQTRIPLEDIVPRFMAAEEQNDSDRLQKLYAKLKTWEPWKQEAVHEALKAERAKRAAASAR